MVCSTLVALNSAQQLRHYLNSVLFLEEKPLSHVHIYTGVFEYTHLKIISAKCELSADLASSTIPLSTVEIQDDVFFCCILNLVGFEAHVEILNSQIILSKLVVGFADVLFVSGSWLNWQWLVISKSNVLGVKGSPEKGVRPAGC